MYSDRRMFSSFKEMNKLQKTESLIWDYLNQGKKNRKSAFHYPTFISIGTEIHSRTLILRDVNKTKLLITFFTDLRSKKRYDIETKNKISVHIYDKKKSIQVCLYGQAKLENNNDITRNYWKEINNFSKLNYASKKSPGSVIMQPENITMLKTDKHIYKNFAVLNIRIHKIDWLELSREGNKRALFCYKNNSFDAKWIIP